MNLGTESIVFYYLCVILYSMSLQLKLFLHNVKKLVRSAFWEDKRLGYGRLKRQQGMIFLAERDSGTLQC